MVITWEFCAYQSKLQNQSSLSPCTLSDVLSTVGPLLTTFQDRSLNLLTVWVSTSSIHKGSSPFNYEWRHLASSNFDTTSWGISHYTKKEWGGWEWVVGPPQSGGMAGTGSPALPGACFMQIPASELLLFLFSLTEGANSGRIWRSGQTHVLVTEWAWLVGVTLAISVLSGEATLLHSSRVIPCACSELRWNYLA